MNKVLLVEGNNDFHVVSCLCQKLGIDEDLFEPKNGKTVDQLLDTFSVLLKGSGDLTTLGMLIDADQHIDKRWGEIQRILEKSKKYEAIPTTIPKTGLILDPIEQADIRVGVWILPNNEFSGMLEDFVLSLIPSNDELLVEAGRILSEIEAKELNRYKNPLHHSKAKIHTWLAWQEVPGAPMGRAISFNYVPTDSSLCSDFRTWLNDLFR